MEIYQAAYHSKARDAPYQAAYHSKGRSTPYRTVNQHQGGTRRSKRGLAVNRNCPPINPRGQKAQKYQRISYRAGRGGRGGAAPPQLSADRRARAVRASVPPGGGGVRGAKPPAGGAGGAAPRETVAPIVHETGIFPSRARSVIALRSRLGGSARGDAFKGRCIPFESARRPLSSCENVAWRAPLHGDW